MKTTFSRMFAMFAALILLCLLLLGVSSRLMLTSFLEKEKRTSLQNQAETLANLASAYEATGDLEQRWGDFHISLTTAAQVAGTDILLCNLQGDVLLCGCNDLSCHHDESGVEQTLVEQIVADGNAFLVDAFAIGMASFSVGNTDRIFCVPFIILLKYGLSSSAFAHSITEMSAFVSTSSAEIPVTSRFIARYALVSAMP